MPMRLKKIDLSSMVCCYQGSVQNLYEIAEHPDLLVSEMTTAGSVFDVGSIFSINGSDVSRACFRHHIYQQLADGQAWVDLASQMRADGRWSLIEKRPELYNLFVDLQEQGVETHHHGMIDASSGEVFSNGFPKALSNLTLIEKFHVHKPVQCSWMGSYFYDYSQRPVELSHHVIPLEFIVRFGVANSSSLLSRYSAMTDGQRSDFLRELGLESLAPWQKFSMPINDCSSKYEPEDRHLLLQEASLVSGLKGEDFCRSLALTALASVFLQSCLSPTGLNLWDLKWEVARKGTQLVIVDTIDTDSMRLTMEVEHDGLPCLVHYSKQAMRDYYRIMHPKWFLAVTEAKAHSKKAGKPFVDLLKDGQASGIYPNNPEPDNKFMDIQENKMKAIRDAVCWQKKLDSKLFYELALSEIDYYAQSQKRQEFQEYNGL